MTSVLDRPPAAIDVPPRPINRGRWWAVASAAVIGWSVWRAGVNPSELINEQGWGQVTDFFAAMFTPDLSAEMLALTVREASVTLGYALLGTALALVIGSVGGVLLTERIWMTQQGSMGYAGSMSYAGSMGQRGSMSFARLGWLCSRALFVVPRSMHEVVFGLLLVNVLGLDPLVAILAIGIPFGAVTARVFAGLLDEVPVEAERSLRASGATRFTAFIYGTVPHALTDLLSYAFYRFECSLRSAAVLGLVGAGGLGFQLSLSFQSLRYEQMWTLLWALIIMSGLADRWSSAVRRRRQTLSAETMSRHGASSGDGESPTVGNQPTSQRIDRGGDRFVRLSALACGLALPIAWWLLDVEVSSLWSSRARTLGGELLADAWPPRLGPRGLAGLVDDALETVALAVLAIALAFAVSSVLAFFAQRPANTSARGSGLMLVRLLPSLGLRFVFLVCRAVPPPVWAFVVVFVLFPGIWPGAVALGIYNAGVLGRLQGEVLENIDQRPARLLAATGASPSGSFTIATVPAATGRFVTLGLYRWEVAIRETVIVGVVGAAGLGRLLRDQVVAFDYDGILSTIGALFVVTLLVDVISAVIKKSTG